MSLLIFLSLFISLAFLSCFPSWLGSTYIKAEKPHACWYPPLPPLPSSDRSESQWPNPPGSRAGHKRAENGPEVAEGVRQTEENVWGFRGGVKGSNLSLGGIWTSRLHCQLPDTYWFAWLTSAKEPNKSPEYWPSTVSRDGRPLPVPSRKVRKCRSPKKALD